MWSNHTEFAAEWVNAWNARDLERVLSHYEDDVVLTSPRVRLILGTDEGTIRGKAALRHYFKTALEKIPDLRFTLDRIFSGVDTVVLEYHSRDGRHAGEFMEFGKSGLVARVAANYALE